VLAGDAWRYSITWVGFAILVAALSVISVLLLVKYRARWRFGGLPLPLLGFLILAVASTAWSFYPLWGALGTLTTILTVTVGLALAISFSRVELLAALGTALRWLLGLSILFELFVSVVVRAPLLPLWYSYPAGKQPLLVYWSRDVLFTGDRIQGIVGNSSLLAMAALFGLIVFGLQLAAGSVGKASGSFWIVVALANVVLTRSATITVAIVIVGLVTAAVLIVRRASTPAGRSPVYWSILGFVVVGAGLAIVFRSQVLGALGKSEDLTGRIGIWEKVIALAVERPVFGWGWISFWVPWAPPFDHLVFRDGVRQLHAHNAWIDLWLQLGIIGVLVFAALFVSTFIRSWSLAIDRPQLEPGHPGKYTAVSMLPLLMMVALLVQSFAESRLLIEYGLVLLTIFSVTTKREQSEPALL
jgi:O-antigen ligase